MGTSRHLTKNPNYENFIQQELEYLAYLHGRWQDEKDYEDFNTYVKAARDKVEKYGMKLTRMTKRPFALYIEDASVGRRYVAKITSRKMTTSTYQL